MKGVCPFKAIPAAAKLSTSDGGVPTLSAAVGRGLIPPCVWGIWGCK